MLEKIKQLNILVNFLQKAITVRLQNMNIPFVQHLIKNTHCNLPLTFIDDDFKFNHKRIRETIYKQSNGLLLDSILINNIASVFSGFQQQNYFIKTILNFKFKIHRKSHVRGMDNNVSGRTQVNTKNFILRLLFHIKVKSRPIQEFFNFLSINSEIKYMPKVYIFAHKYLIFIFVVLK